MVWLTGILFPFHSEKWDWYLGGFSVVFFSYLQQQLRVPAVCSRCRFRMKCKWHYLEDCNQAQELLVLFFTRCLVTCYPWSWEMVLWLAKDSLSGSCPEQAGAFVACRWERLCGLLLWKARSGWEMGESSSAFPAWWACILRSQRCFSLR